MESGTLTYEGANQVCKEGFWYHNGCWYWWRSYHRLSYKELLALFEADAQTEAIVMIGEIGGDLEIQAAHFIKENITKPVVAFIAGQSAPKGKRMDMRVRL